uniref:E1 domain-containing protein n=1 Tax=Anopheles epiroticus TaxID=199890 RepID=A0A182PDY8_9DIPT
MVARWWRYQWDAVNLKMCQSSCFPPPPSVITFLGFLSIFLLLLLHRRFQVYPGRDITNIVESSHYQKIGGWCRQGALNAAKCKGAQRWIKPFRCLEGPFQSDALLVPEGCLFDHIHNASRCWPFVRWNQTGAAACQDRNMQMRSFAMLLPCGISLFSGVEFVCCPKHFKGRW